MWVVLQPNIGDIPYIDEALDIDDVPLSQLKEQQCINGDIPDVDEDNGIHTLDIDGVPLSKSTKRTTLQQGNIKLLQGYTCTLTGRQWQLISWSNILDQTHTSNPAGALKNSRPGYYCQHCSHYCCVVHLFNVSFGEPVSFGESFIRWSCSMQWIFHSVKLFYLVNLSFGEIFHSVAL